MQKGEVAGQILFYSDYAKVIYILSGTLKGKRAEKVVYLLANIWIEFFINWGRILIVRNLKGVFL